MRHLRGDEKLLVWMPRWLGDVQMAEPALAALAAFMVAPARLTIALPRAFFPLLDPKLFHLAPGLGEATLLDANDERAMDTALRAADAALLLRGSFRSALQALRARVPRRIGWARDGRGPLLTDSMRPARERLPQTRRVLPRPFTTAAQELVGSLGVPVRRTEPQLIPTEALLAATRARLTTEGLPEGAPFILINVGGRAGSAKALDDWRPIVAPLLAAGRSIVAVAGPDEQARLDALPKDPRLVAFAASLPELRALSFLCDHAITTDTGPRHILADSLTLFGPTDPRHTASHLARTQMFVGRVPCGPCHQERCPEANKHACFAAIDFEAVIQAALS